MPGGTQATGIAPERSGRGGSHALQCRKRSIAGRWPWTHVLGFLALIPVSLAAHGITPLAFAALVMVVLVAIAAAETTMLRVFRRDVLP